MSWLYSRVLVEAYSAASCSDGEPSAQSSGSPTPQAYLSPGRMTAFSRPSRFGMTFAPLPDAHGEELLTWYREASRAKTSALPGKAQDSTESAPASGPKWRALLGKYDPGTHSLKTSQRSLLEDSTECLRILPRSGSMRSGELFLRAPLVPHIHENDCSLWPTPTKSQATHGFGFTSRTVGRYNATILALADEIGYKPSAATQEALMAFPERWTSLQSLGMPKFQQWQQQHGTCCTQG